MSQSNGAAQSNVANIVSDIDRGGLLAYRIYARDIYGNESYSAVAYRYAKRKGVFNCLPAQSATWGSGTSGTGWRTDTDDVISGYIDGAWGTQNGAWFYGTGISDYCLGYAPDQVRIFVWRNGSLGVSGNNNIQRIADDVKPSGATNVTLVGSSDAGPSLVGSDASAWYTLPGSWLASFADGSAKGIGTVNSGGYRRLRGISNSGAYSGVLEMTFN
jgi:hypothetical protein